MPSEYVKKHSSKVTPLLMTIALEHFTALMGDTLLRHPEQMGGSQADYERMWRWHALEEVEHKAAQIREVLGDACTGHTILYSSAILKKTGLRLKKQTDRQ